MLRKTSSCWQGDIMASAEFSRGDRTIPFRFRPWSSNFKQFLPALRGININKIWFQQIGGYSTYHRFSARMVEVIFDRNLISFKTDRGVWPPHSSHLSSLLNFFLCGHLKDNIYDDKPGKIEQLCLDEKWGKLHQKCA